MNIRVNLVMRKC